MQVLHRYPTDRHFPDRIIAVSECGLFYVEFERSTWNSLTHGLGQRISVTIGTSLFTMPEVFTGNRDWWVKELEPPRRDDEWREELYGFGSGPQSLLDDEPGDPTVRWYRTPAERDAAWHAVITNPNPLVVVRG